MSKIIICVLSLVFGLELFFCINGRADTYTKEEIEQAAAKDVPSAVFAEVKKGSGLCSEASEASVIKTLTRKESAEILKDFSLEWYYIKIDGGSYWTKAENLIIPPDPKTAADELSGREIECYVNSKGFKSKTEYFLWADLYRQRLYLLEGQKGSFSLKRRIVCSSGKNVSPTTRGLFETSDKGEWFYSERLKSGAKYWIRFNGSYLLHSVAMDKDGNITDPTLGVRSSSGCIRINLKDSEYLYKTIPKGTAVWVN
ncbi:MAG: L,D-transpeptidase [Clostridiales bacterium]|nr:L,D-transpeptidase [Clostridiales bacterium]